MRIREPHPPADLAGLKTWVEEQYERILEEARSVSEADPEFSFPEHQRIVSGQDPTEAARKLAGIKKAKPQRQEVYDKLDRLRMPARAQYALLREVLNLISVPIGDALYVEDDYSHPERSIASPIPIRHRDLEKAYRKAKERIEKYVDKQNEKLAQSHYQSEWNPIKITFRPHEVDKPSGRRGRRKDPQTTVIENLFRILQPHIPKKANRTELIHRVLEAFLGCHMEFDAIRQHSKSS